MKLCFWYGAVALLLAGPVRAQSLAGEWQGVEAEPGETEFWPAVLRVQAGKGAAVLAVLYEEVGGDAETTSTFQLDGRRTATGLQLRHARLLDETRPHNRGYWCRGAITFTYDATQEKLTGHATYLPRGECTTGTFTFYRVRLKSAATVLAGARSTLRVSGRDVRWFADAGLTQPVATGNTYPTRLRKATTFYLTQGFYPTAQSPVVALTINVSGKANTLPPTKPLVATVRRPAPAATMPKPAPAPLALPTVLFRVGTAELLPEANPALNQLAAALQARPALRLRIAGHTDNVGESGKNQLLSEQRAAAVKAYLTQAGVADNRLITIGYGDSRPLFPAPDARNRRVEVQAVP
ncbi:OmpA family protein [Hymenobacter sp. H14-R3]|uniref:OmpA family protein n=1 Tax=Hymenobacter sp. H14-R3 TaxID=3046308 RepID=UPI0024B8E3B7|nr:OmpA family protein [Hymenobacter sp. H14-R3]MDJ0365214.1 OmpA family protein [Hymenobacter sp. H14-R3]